MRGDHVRSRVLLRGRGLARFQLARSLVPTAAQGPELTALHHSSRPGLFTLICVAALQRVADPSSAGTSCKTIKPITVPYYQYYRYMYNFLEASHTYEYFL